MTFDIDQFSRQQQEIGRANAKRPGTVAHDVVTSAKGLALMLRYERIEVEKQKGRADFCREHSPDAPNRFFIESQNRMMESPDWAANPDDPRCVY